MRFHDRPLTLLDASHQSAGQNHEADQRTELAVSGSSKSANAETSAAVAGARVIGAPTTNADNAWSWAWRPAVALAKAVGARLILGDVSTRSAWTTPYGSGGVGAERGSPYSEGTTLVANEELALLGRDYLLAQLREAEAEGVEAGAWLADRPGVLALDRFLELFEIDALVVPPLDDPSLGERLAGDDIDAVRRRMSGRPLLVAREDGSLTIDDLADDR
jgi:hypothetical protein